MPRHHRILTWYLCAHVAACAVAATAMAQPAEVEFGAVEFTFDQLPSSDTDVALHYQGPEPGAPEEWWDDLIIIGDMTPPGTFRTIDTTSNPDPPGPPFFKTPFAEIAARLTDGLDGTFLYRDWPSFTTRAAPESDVFFDPSPIDAEGAQITRLTLDLVRFEPMPDDPTNFTTTVRLTIFGEPAIASPFVSVTATASTTYTEQGQPPEQHSVTADSFAQFPLRSDASASGVAPCPQYPTSTCTGSTLSVVPIAGNGYHELRVDSRMDDLRNEETYATEQAHHLCVRFTLDQATPYRLDWVMLSGDQQLLITQAGTCSSGPGDVVRLTGLGAGTEQGTLPPGDYDFALDSSIFILGGHDLIVAEVAADLRLGTPIDARVEIESVARQGPLWDVEVGAAFGHAVAIEGDHAAVGMPHEVEGILSFYRRDATDEYHNNWGRIAFHQGYDGIVDSDFYAWSIDMDGDRAVVGSQLSPRFGLYGRDTGGPGEWEPIAGFDGRSHSVAIAGDTIAVGDPTHASGTGRVEILRRTSTMPETWQHASFISASDAAQGSQFGWALAVDGDYIVVGARGDDTAADDAGAVYVFSRNRQTSLDLWTERHKLLAPEPQANARFGHAVDIHHKTIAVGAIGHDHAGTTDVFNRYVDWDHVVTLRAPDGSIGDQFGNAVALASNTLLVGSPGRDGGSGSAWLYVRDPVTAEGWSLAAELIAGDAPFDDRFGFDVDLHEALAIVGAPEHNAALLVRDFYFDAGAAYFFDVADITPATTISMRPSAVFAQTQQEQRNADAFSFDDYPISTTATSDSADGRVNAFVGLNIQSNGFDTLLIDGEAQASIVSVSDASMWFFVEKDSCMDLEIGQSTPFRIDWFYDEPGDEFHIGSQPSICQLNGDVFNSRDVPPYGTMTGILTPGHYDLHLYGYEYESTTGSFSRQTSSRFDLRLGAAAGPMIRIDTPDRNLCFGETLVVDIALSGAPRDAVGGQFFLEYDTDVLSFTGADPAPPPFDRLIHVAHDPIAGTIDIASGVQDGAPGAQQGVFVTLQFNTQSNHCNAQDTVRFRDNVPPSGVTDDLGAPIDPSFVDLGTISIDGAGPVIDCPPDIVTNADAGLCTATIDVTAATADDPGTCDPVLLIEGTRSDGLPLADPYPLGDTTITWTATDDCGAFELCPQTVTVEPFNQVWIAVELANVDPFDIQRCITFNLHDCSGGASYTAETEMSFSGGIDLVNILVPCGAYTCISAQDVLHTLMRRDDDDFRIGGGGEDADFFASFEGPDALIGGNLNNDRYIDIFDFGVYIGEFATDYGSPHTTCATAFPHADIDGDAIVASDDFTFIQLGFLNEAAPACCETATATGPSASVTVEGLIASGRPELIRADLNHDWLVDDADVLTFLARAGMPDAADWDGDGVTDVLDLLRYVSGWFGGHPDTDTDRHGGITPVDLLTFLDEWFRAIRAPG